MVMKNEGDEWRVCGKGHQYRGSGSCPVCRPRRKKNEAKSMVSMRKDQDIILLHLYEKVKPSLKLKERYFEMFEYRYGLADGVRHTLNETGARFGISGNRANQLIARVKYEIEQSNGGSRNDRIIAE